MRKTVVNMLYLALMIFLGSSVYAQEIEFLKGFKIGGGITLVLQNLQNSNQAIDKFGSPIEPNKTPTMGQYSMYLNVEKEFDDKNTAYIKLETGKGNINNYLRSVATINSNFNDTNTVTVSKAWLKHKFTNTFTIFVGVLSASTDLDKNAYANSDSEQFIGGMFNNAVNIDFARNNFGVKAVLEKDYIDLDAQYIQKANKTDVNLPIDFSRNGFISAQVNFKPGIIDGMTGNYRVYSWLDTSSHVKLTETFEDKMAGNEKDYGFGISLDQQLSDVFGVFGRYSWNRGDVGIINKRKLNKIVSKGAEHVWSIGLQSKVKGIGDKDVIGIAYGQIIPSNDYKKVNIDNEDPKSEKLLEIYYNWKVSDYLSISPDFQMVENPYYKGQDNTAYVGTIRMNISF
jgi:hypothetical protein